MFSQIRKDRSMKLNTNLISIYLKGAAMGAADVVPGVSGGTIAFITGIYDRLLNAIKSVNPSVIKLLLSGRFSEFWQRVDGTFLLVLLLGIGTSIFSLAKIISALLVSHPILVWSFFFGLIVASVVHIFRTIEDFKPILLLWVTLGAVIAYGFTELKPVEVTLSPWVFMAAGSIAICAMILPGVSGSFLLVLMGMYEPVLNAIKTLDFTLIACFGSGAVAGLLLFAHFLSWLLSHYHAITLSFLIGFLIGSLNLVWPWKQTVQYYVDRHGAQKPLEQINVSPAHFEMLTGEASHLVMAVVAMAAGFALVIGLEFVSKKLKH